MIHFKIHRLIFLFILWTTLFLRGEPRHLCALVDDYVVMDLSGRENRYDNGYPQERYDLVLDTLIEEFAPTIRLRGGSFHILRDWGDGAVNAWAWRIGTEFWLEVPGGMSRYHLINEEGFLTVLCHELGHLLGGSPHRNDISYEGQSDYYSSMKCMERILGRLNYLDKNSQGVRALEAKNNDQFECFGDFCLERFEGIKSLTSYYAELEKVKPPTLNTPDLRQVTSTLKTHPTSQCRFDTMIASLACANRDDFSYDNSIDGSCSGIGARPRCWFNPVEFLGHN